MHFDAVLFDFGETLLGRGDGVAALIDSARQRGVDVTEEAARRLWDEIQERGRTPEEMAKGRDLSPEAHRACWTALYAGADAFGSEPLPFFTSPEIWRVTSKVATSLPASPDTLLSFIE